MTHVKCPLGGDAPCIDDLCHGGTTLCGLEPGEDFCEHYRHPDDCPDCNEERDDYTTERPVDLDVEAL